MSSKSLIDAIYLIDVVHIFWKPAPVLPMTCWQVMRLLTQFLSFPGGPHCIVSPLHPDLAEEARPGRSVDRGGTVEARRMSAWNCKWLISQYTGLIGRELLEEPFVPKNAEKIKFLGKKRRTATTVRGKGIIIYVCISVSTIYSPLAPEGTHVHTSILLLRPLAHL